MYYYTVVDKIKGLVLHFPDQESAINEANKRYEKYKNSVRPMNVNLIEEKKGMYTICLTK